MGDEPVFRQLTGHAPMLWQRRLLVELQAGNIPAALDIPTGLGKTSVLALWLMARASGAVLPRRLVYVVDRRAVVDQATEEAWKLRAAVSAEGPAAELRAGLGLGESHDLPISTLRGKFADNREWLADPSLPAIVVGTVDLIGSRLLFEGYGVSRGMRPYHAGLMGADTMIVLDEAHLVPPFERLIEQIENDQQAYGPKADQDRSLVPPLRLMSLSATGGARVGEVFRLRDADHDAVTTKRLGAAKALRFVAPTEEKLEQRLADQAWTLSQHGKSPVRVIVFCNSRDTAEKTLNAIADLAVDPEVAGSEPPAIETELLVGARRVKEREDAKERLAALGFVAGGDAPTGSCFLIATSAGEVGVDLDADHLVCDLVTYDRMVQRFGRVNRRGVRPDTTIVVVEEPAPSPKKAGPPTAQEKARLDSFIRAQAGKALFSQLPKRDTALDASPGALMRLKDHVGSAAVAAASTPAPLRPRLSRALVDAWSMTSLIEHSGRPEIGPWLRGWVDEEPQATVIWRTHLPVREDGTSFLGEDVEAFFDAAPPSANEQLETEVWRVLDWLKKRIATLRKADTAGRTDVFGFVLSQAGDLRDTLRLSTFATADKKILDKAWVSVERAMAGGKLVLVATFGGLREGMLDHAANEDVTSGDTDVAFGTGFAVRIVEGTDAMSSLHVSFRHPTNSSEDSETPSTWLIVQRGENQDGRALAGTAQLLVEHQDWVEEAARGIATRLGLREDLSNAVALAGRLHDEGKKATAWQRAFKAPGDGIYGKTKGPINQSILDGYRHEFGSLPHAEKGLAFKGLHSEMQDLVLHLIAAHHGNARPVITITGCADGPPSVLQDRARNVALRFARLQKRFGPWGLAWLEALVRAADQQASRRLEGTPDG
jgi:CRISPR-associated endonuclease/helicase Cas3